MSNVLVFVPKHKIELQRNYDDFIDFVKNKLTPFADFEYDGKKGWECDKWSWYTAKEQKLTIVHGICDSRHRFTPYEAPYSDFAKAYVRYQQSLKQRDSKGWARPLKWLYRALLEDAERNSKCTIDIMNINNSVIQRTEELISDSPNLSAGTKTYIGSSLAVLLSFIRNMRFKLALQYWKNPFVVPTNTAKKFDQKSREIQLDRCPSDYQMLQVADAFHRAETPRQKYYSSLCVMLMCQPSRSVELKGLTIHSLQRSDKGRWYLMWDPAKGGEPVRKWIPKLLEGVVQQAFKRLVEISKPARLAAKFAYQNPGKFMPSDTCVMPIGFPDDRPLTYDQFASAMGFKVGFSKCERQYKINWNYQSSKWMNNLINDLNGVSKWRAIIPSNCYLRANQVVKKRNEPTEILINFPSYRNCVDYVYQQYKTDNFPYYYGGVPLWDCICLIRDDEFNKVSKVKAFSWSLITLQMVTSAINVKQNERNVSIFEELGITDEDGSPLRLNTHQFRHWLNTKLKLSGEQDWLIAKWSGRADIKQNEAYDGRTPEQQSRLTNMIGHVGKSGNVMTVAQATQRLATYSSEKPPPLAVLHDLSLPISLKSLDVERDGVAQFTGLGYCVHNYAESPCTKSGDCATCSEHVCLMGIPNTIDELKSLERLHEEQLKHAKDSAEDSVYGADRWVTSLGFKLAKLRTIIRMLENPENADDKRVRVIDDLDPSPIKRSLNVDEKEVISTKNVATLDLTALALSNFAE